VDNVAIKQRKMNKHILPNAAFFNSCGVTSGFTSCCCSACDFTLFGRWIGSGFKSKKKREAIAANNLNNFGRENSSSQNVCTAPSPQQPVVAPDNTIVCNNLNMQSPNSGTNTSYAGSGITNKIICKDTTKYCFGQIPSICAIIGNTTTNTTSTGKTITTTKGTNWLAWGLGTVAIIGASVIVYKKFIRKGSVAGK